MDMNTATLPKKGLKTRQNSMDMNKDIATLPKKGLGHYIYKSIPDAKFEVHFVQEGSLVLSH